jgi:putative ABC transport system permease protein
MKQRRLGRWFVGAQVALSTIGLVAAAFMAWGATQLGTITALLPMESVAVGQITLPPNRFSDDAMRAQLVAQLQTATRALPHVRSVSVSSALPGGGGASAALVVNGATSDAAVHDGRMAADEGLFRTYGMKVLAGRGFNASDVASSRRVAVVTPTFVRRHLEGSPLGQRIRLDGVHGADEWAEIVGIANDWFREGPGTNTDRVFLPITQAFPGSLYVSIASDSDPRAIVGSIRPAITSVDRDLPVSDLQTLRARMNWYLRMSRVIAGFCVLGGVGSAIVAAIGLYGVMSFQVRSRIREIGVRMAIGAGSNRIMAEIVRESVARVAPGLLVGMAVAVTAVPALSRFMQGGTKPPAMMLLAVVCVSMVAVGIAAALEPALRASRTSPQVVLRQD